MELYIRNSWKTSKLYNSYIQVPFITFKPIFQNSGQDRVESQFSRKKKPYWTPIGQRHPLNWMAHLMALTGDQIAPLLNILKEVSRKMFIRVLKWTTSQLQGSVADRIGFVSPRYDRNTETSNFNPNSLRGNYERRDI